MSEHASTDRIHDYLDGELPAAEREAVEAHLDACPACAAEVAAWRETLAELAALPDEARPARDLWTGVEARIDEREAAVIPLPTGRRARERVEGGRAGRVSLTFPQLWAAGIALALASGALVWTAMGGPGSAASGGAVAAVEVLDPPGGATVLAATAEQRRAVAALEQILEEGRDELSPETVATVEGSLAAIDEAIAEAERALRSDPNSDLLHRLLVNHRNAKLRLLRQVTSRLQPRT